jgi:spore coat protein U-like protein
VVEIILTGTGRGNEGEEIMKKSMAVFIALAVLAAGGAAWAATTTVPVTATVVGTCKVTATGSVAFGNLDATLDTLVNGIVTQPKFWCTKGASYTIIDDNGKNESGTTFQMKHATDITELIPYTFTYAITGGTGIGPASPVTMDIVSTVPPGYSGALAGEYSDTVTLTISP